jgi:hypothetical protein
MRLLCDAIPFCYGPAAALEALIRALLERSSGLDIEVLASGTTRELLERSDLAVPLLPVDSESTAELSALDIGRYQAFLSVCNPVSLGVLKSRGLPGAYVDFLLWMHSGPAADHFGADLYLAENYPGTADWVDRRGAEIASLTVIPPLIQRPTRQPRRGTLLVGLGGMYSRLTIPGVNTNYATYVTRQILAALPSQRFAEVVIAGPSALAAQLAPLIGSRQGISYCSLSHDEFLRRLGSCEAFLSHPGLYAPFEAMLAGVPTAFLPPSNYTQILQLRHFRALGMGELSLSWDDFPGEPIAGDLAEPVGVAAVLQKVKEAERSAAVSAALRALVSRFCSLDDEGLAALAARQQAHARRFGEGGPRLAAELVRCWFSGLHASGDPAAT